MYIWMKSKEFFFNGHLGKNDQGNHCEVFWVNG